MAGDTINADGRISPDWSMVLGESAPKTFTHSGGEQNST